MSLFRFANAADKDADQPPAAPGEAEQREEASDEVNAVVTDLVPWSISILFHAGLVLLTCFIIWSAQGGADEEKTIIPRTTLGETPEAQLQNTQQQTEVQSSESQVEQSESQTNLQSRVKTTSSLIGAQAESGSSSPFGSTGQTSGSGTRFMGQRVGGNVKRLVFLIDASGSLIDTLPFVIEELKSTIQKLSPSQQFTVIFFRGRKLFPNNAILEVPPPGLKRASAEVKERVTDWISLSSGHVVPGGKAPPVAAVRRALRYQPELLVILSDDITGTGVSQIDQQQLLEEIKKVNRADTKINTIQFLYRDPLADVPGMTSTMKLIARQTGGRYKFVDEQEVRR